MSLTRPWLSGGLLVVLAFRAFVTYGAAPSTAENPPVEWLTKNARPFTTCEPGGTNRDLASLRAIVGNARIVALGEVTYGTHEFFQMKRRIVEYLATQMGFTLFAVEANMPEAYLVNEYILTGRGEPRALLKNISRLVRAQEFLDLVEWMRAFNRSGRGRIQFLGFDMQTPVDSAAAVVTRFVARDEPAYLDSVTRAYQIVASAPKQETQFAAARALFPASVAAGHRVRFSGWIRTDDVHDGFAGLWWRADAGERRVYENMEARRISGTTPWTSYDLTLDIPASTTRVVFGCMLEGSGTAWFDSLAIAIDGSPIQSNEDLDLTMERTDRPVGFSTGQPPGGSFAIDLDSTIAFAGKRSLRIRKVTTESQPPGTTWSEAGVAAGRVLAHLHAGRSRFASSHAPAEVDWAIVNARVIVQSCDVNDGRKTRDAAMADNVAWILDQAPPGSKAVLSAHNLRVARGSSLGSYLAKTYDREMVVFGFAFHEGRYNVIGENGALETREARPSAPGSLEWACHSTGIPRFIEDLRGAKADPGASAWLARPLPMRNIAIQAAPDTIPVAQRFDALIYFDQTTPSAPLH